MVAIKHGRGKTIWIQIRAAICAGYHTLQPFMMIIMTMSLQIENHDEELRHVPCMQASQSNAQGVPFCSRAVRPCAPLYATLHAALCVYTCAWHCGNPEVEKLGIGGCWP